MTLIPMVRMNQTKAKLKIANLADKTSRKTRSKRNLRGKRNIKLTPSTSEEKPLSLT